MTLSHLVIILVATLLGAGVAGLLWLVVGRITGASVREPVQPPEAPDTPAVPLFPDPSLSAHVAAIRDDLDKLANSHQSLMSGMKNWENQLLAEMRAIASAADPEVLIMLNRIASHVGAEPLTAPPPDTNVGAPDPEDPQGVQDAVNHEDSPISAREPDAEPDAEHVPPDPPERPAQQA